MSTQNPNPPGGSPTPSPSPPLALAPASPPPSLTFLLMTLTNIMINLDHGILPACTNQMKQHFNMNETELGFLGSIVYLGIVIVGTLAGHLYLRFHSKLLTLFALVMLEATLMLFILSDHKWTAYVSRFLIGAFQVFLLVYYPVWIDKFGQDKKTLWLTLLQICVPIGIFAGYGITAGILVAGLNYVVSFYIQIGLVAGFIIGFALVPQDKLDCRRQDDHHQQTFMDSIPILKQSLLDSQITGPHPVQAILASHHTNSPTSPTNPTNATNATSPTKGSPCPAPKSYKYSKMMLLLLKSKMYLVGTLTMAIILFVSTGIQFWLTDYFINVLHFRPEKVNIAYAVVSLTGPTSGCGFGGFVINKRGGYQHPTTVYAVFVFACFGIGSAVFLPFVDNFYLAAVLLWIILFFGGAMMPGLTGIMMVSVPPYLRAFGNSNGEIIKNILGYLPAPFMYGWFNSMFGEKAGIKLIMFWGLWAPLLLALGSIYRYRQIKRKVIIIQDYPILQSKYSIPSDPNIESPQKQKAQKKQKKQKKAVKNKKAPVQQNSQASVEQGKKQPIDIN